MNPNDITIDMARDLIPKFTDVDSKQWRLYECIVEIQGLSISPIALSRLARAVVVYAEIIYNPPVVPEVSKDKSKRFKHDG